MTALTYPVPRTIRCVARSRVGIRFEDRMRISATALAPAAAVPLAEAKLLAAMTVQPTCEAMARALYVDGSLETGPLSSDTSP